MTNPLVSLGLQSSIWLWLLEQSGGWRESRLHCKEGGCRQESREEAPASWGGPEQGTEKKRPQREIGTSDQKVALGLDRLSSLKSVPLTDWEP